MNVHIVPLAPSHFEGLRLALDIVAREKRYLAFTEAPPPDVADAFYRNILSNDHSHFVALVDGEVSGWCDVLPTHGQARGHVGTLGMGLVPFARHKGIGHRLIHAAIAKAQSQGLSRIELTVRVDNVAAKALYDRVGFKTEGLNVRSFFVDGQFHDAYAMALLT